jgi:hypothetical protein
MLHPTTASYEELKTALKEVNEGRFASLAHYWYPKTEFEAKNACRVQIGFL